MSYLKQYGTSAKGNDRLLKQYGGSSGSSPMARQHYATGGKVGNPSLAEGLSAAGAEGAPAKPSLARPGKKMPGKGKSAGKGKTNVNVIIAQAPPKGDAPMPPKDMAGPPGPPPGPPMPPPGPPPGMPMRASGGRIANLGKYAHGGKVTTKGDEASKTAKKETHGAEPYAKGGRVKRADGGDVDKSPPNPGEVSNKESAKYLRDKASSDMTKGIVGSAAATAASSPFIGRGRHLTDAVAIGGPLAGMGYAGKKFKDAWNANSEAREFDKAEKGRKTGGRVCRDGGGPVGLREDGKLVGSGGGLGRLAKVRKYGK